MFSTVLSVVLPVIVIVAIGFGWSRLGRSLNSKEMTAIVSDIATPCLIVSTFQASRLSFEAFAAMLGATATAILLFAAIGAVILRLAGLRLRTFLPSIAFPNAGNLGLPIALYGFGQEGLGYAIAYFSISSVANYTLGQTIASGRADWRGLARLPILYAVAIGVGLAFWKVELPGWIGSTIGLLGNITVPVLLLLLGSSLSQLKVGSMGRALFVSVVRIGLGAAVGFSVAAAFGLTGTLRAVLILQCSNPVAVYNYLFAQRWNNEPEAVAGVVVISTLISLVTIPLLLIVLLP
ncbi:AEC family transporter [uncultured Enterovirga sp.]|uniref:AEC family transporter n=1 Tax=uncultured Enterovirga sp. TaxID=2026352 RepID=UPI0035C9A3A1